MPLIPLLPLFHTLNREHFENALTVGAKPIVTLKWSNKRLRKTAGFYRRTLRKDGTRSTEIVLSQPVLENLPRSATESTLCHEMIHAWVDIVLGINEVHGPNFCARMIAINAAQQSFQVSIYHCFPVSVDPPRWWAVCPSCGKRFAYQRLVRGAACRICCNAHYGGNWHSKFLLDYQRAS